MKNKRISSVYLFTSDKFDIVVTREAETVRRSFDNIRYWANGRNQSITHEFCDRLVTRDFISKYTESILHNYT